MTIALINPNLIVLRNDPFTTGIVYFPISLAYVAARLRQENFNIKVIDAFAEAPHQVKSEGKFWVFGLNDQQIIDALPRDVRLVVVYAINLTNHISTISIIRAIKRCKPDLTVVVLENTQAVTGYALKDVAREFYEAGADFIVTGEGEERIVQFVKLSIIEDKKAIESMDGIGSADFYSGPVSFIHDLDRLPFPAWDLFPLQNYWRLRFAHGPLSSGRYLPILTSRGCPYPCQFCVVPATNNQRWRARSAKSVVDEMEFWGSRFQVREFHIEDLNPTISDERIREICQGIIKRNLKVVWKIAAGTKVETIRNEETVDFMARAGCRYISISPETGSPRLLRQMRKPFNLEHAVKLVKRMNHAGIFSQACFVLGYPSETEEDLKMTRNLVHQLTKEGVDEIALFIITPVPGSAIYKEFSGYHSLSELNFTPMWREDYKKLSRFRLALYRSFLWWKFLYHPKKILVQPLRFLSRRFETKMEMTPYRALVLKWHGRRAKDYQPIQEPLRKSTVNGMGLSAKESL